MAEKEEKEKVPIKCVGCRKEVLAVRNKAGEGKLPACWKRHPADETAVFCADCWRGLYKLRAVTFPFASVLKGGELSEFRAVVLDALNRSRALATWALNQLWSHDKQRRPNDEKLEGRPKLDLYKLWQDQWQRDEWHKGTSAAASILHSITSKYVAKRKEIVWYGDSSLPSIRSCPYPIPSKEWDAEWERYEGKDGHFSQVPTVHFSIGGRDWKVRLTSGSEMRYNLNRFEQIVTGEAVKGEMAIYLQRTNGHSKDVTIRVPKAGGSYDARIMIKLVAWLPIITSDDAVDGTLFVNTTRNCFLIAKKDEEERIWRLNADQIRGNIKRHARLLERTSDDTKAEVRMPRRTKERLNERIRKACTHHHRQLDAWVKRSAAMLVKYAARRKVARILYDDSVQTYFDTFRWQELRDRIALLCQEYGVYFEHVKPKKEKKKPTDGQNGND